jgi:hypothetical protein
LVAKLTGILVGIMVLKTVLGKRTNG